MDGLFHTILNMSLTGGFAILAVLVLRLLLKRAPKWISYALWSIVLFRMLCPVSFESAIALLPSAEVMPQATIYAQEPAIGSGITAVDEALNPAIQQYFTPADGASANPAQVFLRSWRWVWVIGVIGMLAYAAAATVRLYSRIRFAVLVSDNVYQSERIDTAFVFGILRPRIYLPSGLTEAQREHILRHERTHIRRVDHVTRSLSYLALALHWFNPLAWLAYALSGRDMEFSCDESVMAHTENDIRKAYSETLLRVSAQNSRLMTPLAFAETDTKGRIRNVLHYKKPVFWVVVAVALAAVAVGVCLLANPVAAGVSEEPPAYSLLHVGANGEIQSYRPSLPAEGTALAEEIIMDYMIKSFAQPGKDIAGLKDYYIIRQTFEKEAHDYYAYLMDGNAVLQPEPGGFCSPIENSLYQRLAAYMAPASNVSSPNPSAAEVNHALAQTQARRLEEHLAEFAEPPRGENGFGSEFSGDWDGDGKPDKAYMHADGQFATIEFGDGMTLTADALILEKMACWGRRFLIESADLTGDGQNEILLFIDLGGNGGHGQYGLYPYRRNDSAWTLMDAPHRGYELALTWKDNIAAVASGNYSEAVGDEAMIRAHYFATDSQDSAQIIWDSLNSTAYYSDNAADAPCDIALTTENGKTLVKISQYITGMTGAHVDKLGYLVTTLEWDERGAYAARDMYFVLFPQ